MAKPTSNVSLTPELVSFVQEQVNSGYYTSGSEVHRAALAAMKKSEEERLARIARLNAEIQKGIDDIEAGRYTAIESPEELGEMMEKCKEEASRRLKARGVKIAP